MAQLTPRQKRFTEEYLKDLNATQAAIRAGYAANSADVEGVRLLGNAKVAEVISQLQKARSERTEITTDMVVKEFAKMGFSNIKNYFSTGWYAKDVDELTDEQAAAIASVEKIVTVTNFDGVTNEKTVFKFRLHDKRGSLDSLGKHLGMFEKVSNDNEVIIRILRE